MRYSFFCFFKQKTAYEMRIRDWSSDVCSSDLLRAEPSGDHRLWEIAVLFHIRDAFRSGDIWLAGSRRYGDLKQLLVPPQAIEQTARLAVPLRPGEWLAERRARLDTRLKEFGRAARTGTIPGGIIE